MNTSRWTEWRLTIKHGLIVTFLITGAFVIVAFLLVAHVSKADFRLSARAEFVGIETESEVVFQLPLSGWTLFNTAKLDSYTNSGQQLTNGEALAASNQTDETLFLIRIPAGAKILIRRYYDESPRYQLVIAEKPFETNLQFPKLPIVLRITDSVGKTYDRNFTENITVQVSPSIEPQLDFRVTADDLQLSTGFRISDIGFARQPENHFTAEDGQIFGVAFPNLLGGWISFLDMPASTMHFARGSDVRFVGVNAVIDSLSLTMDGIEVNASGTVEDVQIRIGRGTRSLMPTQFDKWKNDPITEIALGALSAVFAVATLLLTAISVFPAPQNDSIPGETILINYTIPIVASITLLCSTPIPAQNIPEASKNLVVMVHLQKKGKTPAGFGAGIIISQSDKRTVIATANHVVRDEIGDFRGEIAVEFNSLRGKLFPANANVFYTDYKLDLALLFVDHLSNPDTPRILTDELQYSLSPTAIPNLLNANVQIVGFMNENLWAVSHPEDKVVASSIDGIKVKSGDVAVGASGGALTDSFGRILGMITYIDPQPQPIAVALPMNRILDRVSRWKIESQLKLAKAPTAPKELQALFDNASKIVVNYLGDIDHPFRFSVSVIMPQALAELSPTVSFLISDETNYGQPQLLELFPPHYITEFNCSPDVFKTKISLMLPNGKLIGERGGTLDCETKINQMIAKEEAESPSPRPLRRAEVRGEIAQYKQFKKNQADRDKKYEEMRRKYQMDVRKNAAKVLRDRLVLTASAHPQLDCKYQSLNEEIPQWHCDSRFFTGHSHIEDVIYSIKLGPSREDLYIDIPLNDSILPDTHIAEESLKLLSEGKETVYMSIQLVDGIQLETWRICVVTNLRYPKKACKR